MVDEDGTSFWWRSVWAATKSPLPPTSVREAGREIVRQIDRDSADVVIENFKPGTMEKWGLGPESFESMPIPRLIYARISGYGQTGPYCTQTRLSPP